VGRVELQPAAISNSADAAAARSNAPLRSPTFALRPIQRLSRHWRSVALVAHTGEENDLSRTHNEGARLRMASALVELNQLTQSLTPVLAPHQRGRQIEVTQPRVEPLRVRQG
jgi:hypothetical protein